MARQDSAQWSVPAVRLIQQVIDRGYATCGSRESHDVSLSRAGVICGIGPHIVEGIRLQAGHGAVDVFAELNLDVGVGHHVHSILAWCVRDDGGLYEGWFREQTQGRKEQKKRQRSELLHGRVIP